MIRKELDTSLIMPVTSGFIERRIILIRGNKVLLGQTLAELYDVPVKVLIQSVKRNKERFPNDFMFQLDSHEFTNLKSQIVTSSWGGIRKSPYAFTELGVAMLSSVLNSDRAVRMNIFIMRAFVKLREFIANDRELTHKIETIVRRQNTQSSEITSLILVMSKMRKDVSKLLKEKIKLKSAIGFEV